ncbi:hypothetical protein QT381_01620 [Galbitalea sp. SE-J8]|nr:hypothetical protein [Galbitalea sp. SE-J8]MDM4761703.1 hypothetical protein [Galbitalea sp. SE-J8]
MDLLTFVPPAIAFTVFLVFGVITWSYRDVYHRHESSETSGHDTHAGH